MESRNTPIIYTTEFLSVLLSDIEKHSYSIRQPHDILLG